MVAGVALPKCKFLNPQAKAPAMIEILWRAHPAHQQRIRCMQHSSMEETAPAEGETITRPFLVDPEHLQPVPLEAAIVVCLDTIWGSRSAVVHLKRLSD